MACASTLSLSLYESVGTEETVQVFVGNVSQLQSLKTVGPGHLALGVAAITSNRQEPLSPWFSYSAQITEDRHLFIPLLRD